MREFFAQSLVGFVAAWVCFPVLAVLLSVFESKHLKENLPLVAVSSLLPVIANVLWVAYGQYWSVVFYFLGALAVVVTLRRSR